MREAAEYYGFRVNRQGRMPCPFHNGRDPNFRVYPGSRGYHCFVCGETGSVIDFVAKLFRLTPRQAALRLNEDFRLGLSGEMSREDAEQWRRERAESACKAREYRMEYLSRCALAREIRGITPPWQDLPDAGEYAALLGRLEYLDYWFSVNEWR